MIPAIWLFGNTILSFLVKAASGYWKIMGPTNGYTAIHERALRQLNLNKISSRFFFESDMLIHLNIINAVVKDIDVPNQIRRTAEHPEPWENPFPVPSPADEGACVIQSQENPPRRP